jgi:hypothetical protein
MIRQRVIIIIIQPSLLTVDSGGFRKQRSSFTCRHGGGLRDTNTCRARAKTSVRKSCVPERKSPGLAAYSTESNAPQAAAIGNTLLASDIKRLLERPGEIVRPAHAPDAPPGAPIGDFPKDWLARPPL